jgi:ABC-type branched-subunit amino acid transport system substrate-binding protein
VAAASVRVAFIDRPDAGAAAFDAVVAAAAEYAHDRGEIRIEIAKALTPDAIAAIVHGDMLCDRAIVAGLERAGIPVILFAGERNPDAGTLRALRLCGDATGETEHAVRHLRMHGVRNWAVLGADTTAGRARASAAARIIPEFGGAVMVRHEFAGDDLRFESALAGAARAGVQAVLLAASPGTSQERATLAATTLAAMRRSRLPGLLHLPGAFVAEETLAALGRDGEGAIAASAGGELRHATAAIGLIIDLIAQTGPDARRLGGALRELRGHPGPLGPVTFDERGDNQGASYSIHVIDDGRWVRWEASDFALGLRRLPGVLP